MDAPERLMKQVRKCIQETKLWITQSDHQALQHIAMVCLVLVSMSLQAVLVKASVYGPLASDAYYYYHWLVTLAVDRDWDFTNNYRQVGPYGEPTDPYKFLKNIDPATGKPQNLFPMGSMLLWYPFFEPAYADALCSRPMDVEPVALAYSKQVATTTSLSSVFYAHLAMVMLALVLRRYAGLLPSMVAGLSILWATNALHYIVHEPLFSHIPDLLAVSWLLWCADRWLARPKVISATIWGLAAGLTVSIRPQNALSVVAVIGIVAFFVWRRRVAVTHLWRNCAGFVLGLVLTASPYVLTRSMMYGRPWVVPLGPDFLRWSQPQIIKVLFSTERGLFVYSPYLLLVAVAGTISIYRARRDPDFPAPLLWLCLGVFLTQLYINSAVRDWWGGGAFGQRRFISTYSLFVVLAVIAWRTLASRARQRRSKMVVVGLVSVVLFGLTACNFYLDDLEIFVWHGNAFAPRNILFELGQSFSTSLRAAFPALRPCRNATLLPKDWQWRQEPSVKPSVISSRRNGSSYTVTARHVTSPVFDFERPIVAHTPLYFGVNVASQGDEPLSVAVILWNLDSAGPERLERQYSLWGTRWLEVGGQFNRPATLIRLQVIASVQDDSTFTLTVPEPSVCIISSE